MAQDLPEHYAESVMVASLSKNGVEDVSFRLARFPDRGIAHVWLHVATSNGAWSLVDESFEPVHRDATPVRDDSAEFRAVRERQWLLYEADGRNGGRLHGRVTGQLLVVPTRHPLNQSGNLPLAIDVHFEARSPGYRSPMNRWEITGRLSGTIAIGSERLEFDHDDGKWHEQIGPRPRFAPAFSYFNVQNDRLALLAMGFARGASGYALIGNETVGVASLVIDPVGTRERAFSVTLEDGRRVEGRSRTVQEWSVPIEGRRRPGSSVIAESNFGRLLGTLNDWDPGTQ